MAASSTPVTGGGVPRGEPQIQLFEVTDDGRVLEGSVSSFLARPLPADVAAAEQALQIAPGGLTLEGGGAVSLEDGAGDWPVREQGLVRGTCVAFAVVAMLELRARLDQAQRGDPVTGLELSEEHLDAAIRRHPDLEGQGPAAPTLIEHALHVLRGPHGICRRADLPYRTAAPADADEVAAAQPMALPIAGVYRRMHFPPGSRPNFSLSAVILERLRTGFPVVAGFAMHFSGRGRRRSVWTGGDGLRYGAIADPPRLEDDPDSGHVVCITGYRPDPETPGAGWFVFRNSWGKRFGRDFDDLAQAREAGAPWAPPRPGYGTISTAHVDAHCWELTARAGRPRWT